MSKRKYIKSKSGFTIIEVVLVLAVAGLIFLMVFVALPALQRNQRDSQRRQDYGDLSGAITGYYANNSRYPIAGTIMDPDVYVNKDGKDPQDGLYVVRVVQATGTSGITGTPGNVASVKTSASGGGSVQIAIPKADLDQPVNTASGKQVQGNEVYVVTHADCSGTDSNGNSAPNYTTSGRAFAVYGYLESGTYCQAST